MTDPIALLADNWEKARSAGDSNAEFCALATAAANGQVSLRTLVLRKVEGRSLLLFVNGSSPKWEQLEQTRSWELLVFWPSLMQQYRIRGELGLLPREELEASWGRRPYHSKLLDHFYAEIRPQSAPIPSREALTSGIRRLESRYPDPDSVPCPPQAKGLLLHASQVELWRARKDRLHDRHLYTRTPSGWRCEILVP